MTVTWEQIGDAMLTALAPIHLDVAGKPGAYLRQLAWHAGEFTSRDALTQSGIAGRCPAALVDFGGERTMRATVGGRTELVEADFVVICASDSMRSRRDREVGALLPLARDIRQRLHGRTLGLMIFKLTYQGLQLVVQEPQLFAFAVKFRTRYWCDLATNNSDAVDLDAMAAALKVGDLTVVSSQQTF